MSAAVRRLLPPALLTTVLLVAWEGYVRATAVSPTILPGPWRVLRASIDAREVLWYHARQTMLETAAGFVLAVVVAVICAAAIDFFLPARRALFPLLIVSQTVPIIAIAPLLVLWFGYGTLPKVLVVALVCFFPMVVAAAHGLASTEPELTRLYRTFGASRWQRFVLVRVPVALPAFFTGAKIAITYSVIGAVFGEYVGASRGLGILLQTAKNSYRTDLVFAMIGVTAGLSLALYGLAVLLERLLIPWARTAGDHHAPESST